MMKLYHVECDQGYNQYIFAHSFDHAAEQFVTWQIANGVPMGDFSIGQISIRSLPPVEAGDLRDALRRGMEGIGRYDAEGGWCIRPIDDERPG
jgi:hypothetical protein